MVVVGYVGEISKTKNPTRGALFSLFLFCTHFNVLHSLTPMLDSANLPMTSKLTTFLPTHPIQDHCFLTGPLPALFNKAS